MMVLFLVIGELLGGQQGMIAFEGAQRQRVKLDANHFEQLFHAITELIVRRQHLGFDPIGSGLGLAPIVDDFFKIHADAHEKARTLQS